MEKIESPQNLKPQNLKPQNLKPQKLKPQKLKPQNLKPQKLKPQKLKPQNLKLPAKSVIPANLPQAFSHGSGRQGIDSEFGAWLIKYGVLTVETVRSMALRNVARNTGVKLLLSEEVKFTYFSILVITEHTFRYCLIDFCNINALDSVLV
jgi:hypothetical protein